MIDGKWILVCVVLFVGCGSAGSGGDGGTDPDPDPEPSGSTTSLVSYAHCEDVLADLQAQAIALMEESLENYSLVCSDSEDSDDMMTDETDETDADDTAGSGGAGDTAGETDVDYTDTNLIEAGVDEADILKTDGEYVYVAGGETVDVFLAWPVEDFQKVASYSFADDLTSIAGLFLHDQKLIVLGMRYQTGVERTLGGVIILDVSDPANPRREKERFFEGELVESRLSADVLHLVLTGSFYHALDLAYPDFNSEMRQKACDGDNEARQELAAQIEEVRESNHAKIMALVLADFLPHAWQDGTEKVCDCRDFYSEQPADAQQAVVLYSLNLADSQVAEQWTVVQSQSNYVYATPESFYLATTSDMTQTNIHRFSLGGQTLHSYWGSNAVEGTIGSAFAMNEHAGALRVATSRYFEDGEFSSSVFVLDTHDAALPVRGALHHIAPWEYLYAVRFIGERGYLVTFKKVDPLFVLDLEDPENPRIAGELEMPGYSTYLHPLDDTHLIGLGKDAEDMGDFAWYQGLKLAVFDVGDVAVPELVDDLIIGSRGSDSPALYEHHAFHFDSERSLLALPLVLYTGGTGESSYGTFEYNGVHLYQVTTAGIETQAEIVINRQVYNFAQRVVLIGDDETQAMYVLDDTSLHQIDWAGFVVAQSLDLSETDYYQYIE